MNVTTTPLSHDNLEEFENLITLPQLDALLQRAGFDLVERHGDWDGSPLAARSEHIISVCR